MTETNNFSNLVVGDTLKFTDNVKENGSVKDVSGATSMLLTIKENYNSTTNFAQVSGSFVTNGTDGKILYIVPKETTASAIANKSYVYDIQIVISGERFTTSRGSLIFVEEVTTN